jgi:hypothetical protein
LKHRLLPLKNTPEDHDPKGAVTGEGIGIGWDLGAGLPEEPSPNPLGHPKFSRKGSARIPGVAGHDIGTPFHSLRHGHEILWIFSEITLEQDGQIALGIA